MAIVSSGTLMDTLQQYDLLATDQHAQLFQLAGGRRTDARALAKILVRKGWLSIYQINQLLADKGGELVIGPYRVVDKLGQGGLSQVFKAKHRDYDQSVAIKIIRRDVFATPAGRAQFLQEVEAMARLDHINIVQFCDADSWRDTYYFAMEYVDGLDLGKIIRLSGSLAVAQACEYIRQAALGLQHAYERNLVHRDIKPVNLLLTHDFARSRPGGTSKATQRAKPLIKILDWGLAACRAPKSSPTGPVDFASGLIGTADYLSPEQACNANSVDIRGDVYSLGCSLYFLLTGHAPFPDGTLMQKILQHQQAEPKPLEAFRDDVPAEVCAIVRRMMAKNPLDRFQTPAAVAVALLEFTRASQSTDAAPGSPRQQNHTPLPRALADKAPVRHTLRHRSDDTNIDTAVP